MGKLLKKSSLDTEIRKRHQKGMPIYGSCAGAILLANEILASDQPKLNLVDISISRNSYGRQIDSFESDISIKGFRKPFHAVFIRAPKIEQIRDGVKILAKHNKLPVLARTKNILVSTFHPELTNDTRIHEFFIKMIRRQ
jgi:5'-phosphate synthase pdxT subunit